jgi:HSP20 family protein
MSKEKEKKGETAEQGSEVAARPSDRPGGHGDTLARRDPSTPALRTGDPLAPMRRFADDMERFFDDFGFGRGPLMPWLFGGRRGGLLSRGMGMDLAAWSPQMEVFRRDNRLVVRADLPGLSKDDIQVEVRDDAITIQGERRQEHEDEFRSERSYGSFFRSIPLPEGVEAGKAEANFRDGVLEITMPAPRGDAKRGRRIEIKA